MENTQRLADKFGLEVKDIKALELIAGQANTVLDDLGRSFITNLDYANSESNLDTHSVKYDYCSVDTTKYERMKNPFLVHKFSHFTSVANIIKNTRALFDSFERRVQDYFLSRYERIPTNLMQGLINRMTDDRFKLVYEFDGEYYSNWFKFRFDIEKFLDSFVEVNYGVGFKGFKELYNQLFRVNTKLKFYNYDGDLRFEIDNTPTLTTTKTFVPYNFHSFKNKHSYTKEFLTELVKIFSFWYNDGKTVDLIDEDILNTYHNKGIEEEKEVTFIGMADRVKSVRFYKNGRSDIKFNSLKDKIEFMNFYNIENEKIGSKDNYHN